MVEKGERSHGDYVGDNRSSKRHAANRDNYNEYFEMISDELVILIFTKLSSSSSSSSDEEAVDTLDDIKLVAQCSILSKRFNLLVSQVPTLSINSSNFEKIYNLCPKILKKFKHITSLQINHSTCHERRKREGLTKLPSVLCEATYRPHSYFLSVVSYESLTFYHDQQFKDSLMIANAAAAADPARVFLTVVFHVVELMLLHHMLVSSIKDLENLQRVVVTNLDDGGMFILEADILVELRNCSATNLEQVQPRCWSRCFHYYDVPYDVKGAGLLARNMGFYVFEWYEKTTNDQIVYDDDEVGIPRALACSGYKGEVHKFLLKSLLANTYDINVNQKFEVIANQDQIIPAVLADLKDLGNLL